VDRVVVTHPSLVAQQPPGPAAAAPVIPQYDPERNLKLPDDYRQWTRVGSSLGLSYAEASRPSDVQLRTAQ
jgi:hypothetical protein